jgi:hypothetical protein
MHCQGFAADSRWTTGLLRSECREYRRRSQGSEHYSTALLATRHRPDDEDRVAGRVQQVECARPTLRLAVSAVRRPWYSTRESTHPHRSPRATRTRCDRGRPLDNPASGVCSRVPDRAAPSAQRLFERDVIEASVPDAGEGSRAHIAGIGTPRASDTRPSSAGTPLRSQTGVETGANPSERAGAARPTLLIGPC